MSKNVPSCRGSKCPDGIDGSSARFPAVSLKFPSIRGENKSPSTLKSCVCLFNGFVVFLRSFCQLSRGLRAATFFSHDCSS